MKHNLMASECYLKGGIEAQFKFPCLDLCSLCIKRILQKPRTGWLTHLYFESNAIWKDLILKKILKVYGFNESHDRLWQNLQF